MTRTLWYLLVCLFSVSIAAADTVRLVRDINPAPIFSPSSIPRSFFGASTGITYFSHFDSPNGWELWRSDGTSEGTGVLLNIYPGSASSAGSPADSDDVVMKFAEVGRIIYFAADDGTHGRELWRSDGTSSGTYMVKDIIPGGPHNTALFSSSPTSLTAAGSTLFFVVGDRDGERRDLWKSDGTADGTVLVKAGISSRFSSDDPNLIWYRDALFFLVSQSDGTTELWRSDGTPSGTRAFEQNAQPLIVHEGLLFLTRYNRSTGEVEVLRTDGSAAGTVNVVNVPTSNPSDRTFALSFGNTLFFGSSGIGFWRIDGTSVTKVANAPLVSRDAVAARGKLFFVSGNQIWQSDGTPAGTAAVIPAGPKYTQPDRPVVLGDVVYFCAAGDNKGRELWRTDGTAEGTFLVQDSVPGIDSHGVESLTAANGMLFYAGADSTGWSPWISDGRETRRLLPLQPAGASANPGRANIVNGRALFAASNNETGRELWSSDGTSAGTRLVKDIKPGPASALPNSDPAPMYATLNGVLYFAADNGTEGSELWRSDGTEAGTFMVRDLSPGPISSTPRGFTLLGNRLLFTAANSFGNVGLWSSDGTADGTRLLKSVAISQVFFFAVLGDFALFTSLDANYGQELWKTDGTPEGTGLVKEFRPGETSGVLSFVEGAGNKAYFVADDGVHGGELWLTDGTTEGTRLVKEITPGPAGSEIYGMGEAAGLLFFLNGRGALWRSDGTESGTIPLASFVDLASVEFGFESFVGWNGSAYFFADDGIHGFELWRSDGTPAGTAMFADIYPGPLSSVPYSSTTLRLPFGSASGLYFPATDGEHGLELWRTDGTTAGTRLAVDISAGPANSNPTGFFALNGKTFLSAHTAETGQELFELVIPSIQRRRAVRR